MTKTLGIKNAMIICYIGTMTINLNAPFSRMSQREMETDNLVRLLKNRARLKVFDCFKIKCKIKKQYCTPVNTFDLN